MEASLQEELQYVERQLLKVDHDLHSLLQLQEHLQERKQVLQAQLKSLDFTHKEGEHGHQHHETDWETGQFSWSSKVMSVLKTHFKVDSLRPLQASAINATLSGRDLVLIMPTGGGKSLCYQLPALVGEGITLVISPLVSLMEDQMIAVTSMGIESAMLNASSSKAEVKRVHGAMTEAKSSLLLLYVTPEKLAKSKRFMSKLEKMYEMGRLVRIVIDEVHCASQWGHDFRPDYKILGILKRQFPTAPILGLTATASAKVLSECQNLLCMKMCLVFRASYNRPNLFYELRSKPSSTKAQLKEITDLIKSQFSKQSGIIYCFTRNNTEEVCAGLCESGIKAGYYHAYVSPGQRTRVHSQWLKNQLQVIVATVAFGMGIDKPDVRFVIHHSISKSIENYYQESGRAGRDGEKAHCIIFYRSADVFKKSTMVFTEHAGLKNLYSMVAFCLNEVECRRKMIATSFGEAWKSEDCPLACDVCQKLNWCCQNDIPDMQPSTSQKTTKCYTIEKSDISVQCKDLVIIVEHHKALEQRVTATKLVDVWRGQGSSTRSSHLPHCTTSADQCERVLVTAILQRVLKEEFHFTAYSTISYVGLGEKANAMKRDLFQIELSSIKEIRSNDVSTKRSAGYMKSKCPITNTTSTGKPTLSVAGKSTIHLPSMLPEEGLLEMETWSTLSRSPATVPVSTSSLAPASQSPKKVGRKRLGKGVKRVSLCEDCPQSDKRKKLPFASDCIEISDSD